MTKDGIIRGELGLLVFRAGSPTPIYESRAMQMFGWFIPNGDYYDEKVAEQEGLDSLVRILIHDWQKFSETLR